MVSLEEKGAGRVSRFIPALSAPDAKTPRELALEKKRARVEAHRRSLSKTIPDPPLKPLDTFLKPDSATTMAYFNEDGTLLAASGVWSDRDPAILFQEELGLIPGFRDWEMKGLLTEADKHYAAEFAEAALGAFD